MDWRTTFAHISKRSGGTLTLKTRPNLGVRQLEEDEALAAHRGLPTPDALHQFSSTHFTLPADVSARVLSLGGTIPESALAEDGREFTPHCTLIHGLHTEDCEEVRRALGDADPVNVTLGGISCFYGAHTGKPYDVVKVDVDSPALFRLRARLAKRLENTQAFDGYAPHITLCYVCAGLGKTFKGSSGLEGEKVLLKDLIFSDRSGKKTGFDLSVKQTLHGSLESTKSLAPAPAQSANVQSLGGALVPYPGQSHLPAKGKKRPHWRSIHARIMGRDTHAPRLTTKSGFQNEFGSDEGLYFDWLDELKAVGSSHAPGDVWPGVKNPNRFWTKRPDGRVVPAKNPNRKAPPPRPTREQQAVARQEKKTKSLAEVQQHIQGLLDDPSKITPDSLKEVAALISGKLTVPQIHQLKEAFGLHASGKKSELATKLAQRALARERKKEVPPDERTDRPGDGAGGEATDGKPPEASGPVEAEVERPPDPEADTRGDDAGQPADKGSPERVPASLPEVNKRIGRFENFFRAKGQHQTADWMGKLREHVNAVGGEAALQALGEDRGEGSKDKIQYGGVDEESKNWKSMEEFIKGYLDRNGIVPLLGEAVAVEGVPVLSSQTNSQEWQDRQNYLAADFAPIEPIYDNKLQESKDLPGLESSEDISVLMGKPVTHLTPEVMAKLDEKYGKGRWIVKAYGDMAAAGYGIFFPQRAAQLAQDAKNVIWSSGEALGRYGFEHLREKPSGGFGDALKKLGGLSLPEHAPDADYNRWDQSPEVRKEYSQKVLAAAEEHGMLLDPKTLERATSSPNVGGLEHDVHEDRASGRFVKFTKDGRFGQSRDLPEYLERFALTNQLWPELGCKFEGLVKNPHTGEPQAVTSMNRIEGTQPEQHEIHAWFESHGFQPEGERHQGDNGEDLGQRDWIDPKTGTSVRDAVAGNFRKKPDGALVPIDVDVIPGEKAREQIKKGDEHTRITGIRHKDGAEYRFGTDHYNQTIHGEARHWADSAAAAADNERGAQLPDNGKDFMAQPAFKAVGVSDADRAAGRTIAPGEGRVHLQTRNGKVEVIPHSTWIKGESLPVVFESEDTKAMAKAAQEAIDKLPERARFGQVYAPDVLKTEDGYRVVELNASVEYGGSGYLSDNPFIIDSYVSNLTQREPAHVRFIRKLLTDRKSKEKAADAGGKANAV